MIGYQPWNKIENHPKVDEFVEGAKAMQEDCARHIDVIADGMERCWNEYIASGKGGPATSFHTVYRDLAQQLRNLRLPTRR